MGFLKYFFTVICFISVQFASYGKSDEDKDDKKEERVTEDSPYRSFLEVGNLTVPVIKRDKVYAYIKMKVQILTKDGSSIEPYRPYKKRLYDAYFSDIYAVMADRWLPPKEPTQASVLKRLEAQTDKVVGSDKLQTVLTMYYFYKNPENKE